MLPKYCLDMLVNLKCLDGCIWCIYYSFLLLIYNHIYNPLMCWSSCRSVLSRIQHSLALRASCAESGSPGCQWRFITAIVVLFFEEEWTLPTLPYRHIQYEYNDFNYLFYCFISPPLILKSISMVIDVSMYVRIDMQAAESDSNT